MLVQAGSSGPGQALAARQAEVVFTVQQDPESAVAFAKGLREQVAAVERGPRHCLIMPGLMPVIGEAEAEAHEKFALLQSLTDQSNALTIP
ncbi:LLM class flavin-dependent oxidoreductase [Cupriavidus consociatus]|uniref:LLM class flavin-dependent oxidoreductase n=1 Tax=Cupriavidus consociatus TaxID=2821357 RepID=UPI0024DFC483|nr:LLM class flavin-dependent oxidoreductase [Cupriavidus sp. LEh21]MDK2662078.1 LLM class flavin-dependent oxidoreductase [Cupriavidus sp. LEh21]